MQLTNTLVDDCWIVDELVRIKTLEREVSRALERRTGVAADASLCNWVAELNRRVDLLDCALGRDSYDWPVGPKSRESVIPLRPRTDDALVSK
jgi:hypothetical protein